MRNDGEDRGDQQSMPFAEGRSGINNTRSVLEKESDADLGVGAPVTYTCSV